LAHEESERQRLQGTENKYWTGVYDTLLNHQENYTKILEKHHKEQLELLVQIHQEERRTFETERNEIEELCRDQNRSDMEKEDFLAIITEIEQQVLQNHTAQIKEFKSVQNEDLIALKREQKIYRQEVKKTAPDTILYVYAKTKKEKGRKKEKKIEFKSKLVDDTDPEHHIGPSSPGGPTRSTSAMMMKKKRSNPLAVRTETTEKIRHKHRRLSKGGDPSPQKSKKKDNVNYKENNQIPDLHITDYDDEKLPKIGNNNPFINAEEFSPLQIKITEDNTLI